VKFSIERIADPKNESPYAGDWATLKEVEIKDKLSGLIHLKEAFAPLWTSTLPTPSGTILSSKRGDRSRRQARRHRSRAVGSLSPQGMAAEAAYRAGPQSRLEVRAGRL
jgi:hypothetical protein